MKKNLNRALSMLLSILMVFSLFPLNILAATKSNEGGDDYDDNNMKEVKTYGNYGGYTGMRFSLYFAEGNWSNIDAVNADKNIQWQKIGKTVDMIQNGNGDGIRFVSSMDVYDRMAEDNMGTLEVDSFEYLEKGEYNYVKPSDIGFDSFPTIIAESGLDPERFTKFLMGSIPANPTQEQWERIEKEKLWETQCINLIKLTDYILDGTEIQVDSNAFVHGYYTFCGIPHKGIFKLYLEPMIGFYDKAKGEDKPYIGTARDLIAIDNAHPSKRATHNITNAYMRVGNAAWIVDDEPQVNMKGRGTSAKSYGNNDIVGRVTDTSSDYYLSAGLATITGFPFGPSDTALPVHIVTYYVTIGEDGKYKMLQDPEVRQVDESSDLVKVTYTGTDGNNLVMQTNMLYVEPEDVVKKGNYEGDKCYLNDVITSAEHYDKATLESGVDWLYTTPSVNGNYLQRPMVVKDKLEILVENPEDVDISQLDALKEQKMSNSGSVDGVVTSDYVNVAKGGVGAGNALTVGNHGDKKYNSVNIPGLSSEYGTWLMGS